MSVSEEECSSLLLLDTHVLLWLIEGYGSLRAVARAQIEQAADENRLRVSAITPWEIALLVSKGRLNLDRDVMIWIEETLTMPGISLVPLSPEIAVASTRFPFEMHSDPADRILVATARQLGAMLVTADRALLALATRACFRALDAEQ